MKAGRHWKGNLLRNPFLQKGSIKEEMESRSGAKVIRYEVEFDVEPDFGAPGEVVLKNEHKHEFFLQNASLQGDNNHIVHFVCNSWIFPFHLTKQERVFFPNTHESDDGFTLVLELPETDTLFGKKEEIT